MYAEVGMLIGGSGDREKVLFAKENGFEEKQLKYHRIVGKYTWE